MATIPDIGSIYQRAAEATARKAYMPKGTVVGRDPADDNCQEFFRQVAKELKRQQYPSWQLELDAWDYKAAQEGKSNAQANDIFNEIGKSPNWQPVLPGHAQPLANEGAIIVGVSPGKKNGYIAFVQPMPSGSLEAHKGSTGPLVRDGNEHPNHDGSWACSSWGATRASRGWGTLSVVKWYVWKHSAPETMFGIVSSTGTLG